MVLIRSHIVSLLPDYNIVVCNYRYRYIIFIHNLPLAISLILVHHLHLTNTNSPCTRTLGLISAMFIFLWNVGSLCYAYGEGLVSGVAFFLLVAVTCVSVVGSYLFALGGTVAVGANYVVKQEQRRLAAGGERRQQRVRY